MAQALTVDAVGPPPSYPEPEAPTRFQLRLEEELENAFVELGDEIGAYIAERGLVDVGWTTESGWQEWYDDATADGAIQAMCEATFAMIDVGNLMMEPQRFAGDAGAELDRRLTDGHDAIARGFRILSGHAVPSTIEPERHYREAIGPRRPRPRVFRATPVPQPSRNRRRTRPRARRTRATRRGPPSEPPSPRCSRRLRAAA